MDINSLICDFQGVNIKEDSNDQPRFLLNNGIKTGHLKFHFVTDVMLDFFQVWSMFNKIPMVNKKKYEWRFTTTKNSDVVFILCAKDKVNFINTKNWRILTNVKDNEIIDHFLATLCEALECYNTYYKESIETRVFTSADPLINTCLQQIKSSIIKNSDILKNL